MNNDSPQLPPPTDRYHDLLPKYWLDYSKDYPEPHYMLKYNGVEFSPLGGLQAITGHQKNGKTFLCAMFMAAILNPHSERVRSRLHGLEAVQETLDFIGHPPRVLYIDTEMEDLNTVKVARRVQWLCQWPKDERNPNFAVLWLRAVDDDPDQKVERWKLTQQAIMEFEPDFVVLDGIVDIVHDFNDNAESGQIIGEIMTIATRRDICIWTCLHQNPGQDALSKMKGHLGTELANKSSDTFVSIKEKKGNVVTFTVKQINARNKDVEDWKYEITDDAGKLGVPRILDENNIGAMVDTEKEELKKFLKVDEWTAAGMSQSEIARMVGKKPNQIYTQLNSAVEKGIIYRSAINKRYYKGTNPNASSDDHPLGEPTNDLAF